MRKIIEPFYKIFCKLYIFQIEDIFSKNKDYLQSILRSCETQLDAVKEKLKTLAQELIEVLTFLLYFYLTFSYILTMSLLCITNVRNTLYVFYTIKISVFACIYLDESPLWPQRRLWFSDRSMVIYLKILPQIFLKFWIGIF